MSREVMICRAIRPDIKGGCTETAVKTVTFKDNQRVVMCAECAVRSVEMMPGAVVKVENLR